MTTKPQDLKTNLKAGPPPTRQTGWSRFAWIAYSSFCALIIVIHLFRWTQGHNGLASLLAPTGLLIIGLARVFNLRGTAYVISQVVCGVLLILATIMLLTQ